MRKVSMTECHDTVRTLFFNSAGFTPVEIELPKDYRAYNNVIGASTGTVVDLEWVKKHDGCGRNYSIWLDDDGLLRGRPLNPMAIALASKDGELRSPLVGCGLLLVSDNDGETQSMTFEEMQVIVRGSLLTRASLSAMVSRWLKAV